MMNNVFYINSLQDEYKILTMQFALMPSTKYHSPNGCFPFIETILYVVRLPMLLFQYMFMLCDFKCLGNFSYRSSKSHALSVVV